MSLETDRLILRDWRDSDRETYAGFTADPEVRRFYPDMLSREQTDAMIDRFIAGMARDGYGFWAVERKSDGALIGDVGFCPVGMALRNSPPVEIGWLLGQPYWGQGYAPEAARACLDFAFGTFGFSEVVAFTAVPNRPSQRVMEKIGMTIDPLGNFEHPNIPEGHALRSHLLYRIANPASPAAPQ